MMTFFRRLFSSGVKKGKLGYGSYKFSFLGKERGRTVGPIGSPSFC